MPRLNYVGPAPTLASEVINKAQGTDIINGATVNRTATSTAIETAAGLKASKSYIDLADAAFATSDYYQTQDNLNIATSSIGVASGVASLVGGKIPLGQIPVLGSGYVKGPFGPTTIVAVNNAGTTPVKVAEFTIGNQSVAFQPLAYALVAVDSTPGGRPIVEIRMSNGTAVYSSQTLIAQGIGRSMFSGRQIVAVTPASAVSGANPSPWSVSTNIVASMWIYSSSAVPVTVASSSVLSASVFLARMTA